ncbi:MAG: helix-turn-helix domain-containing protein [Cyanobacteria bacterium J06648_11]
MDVSGLEPEQLDVLATIGLQLRHAREARGWSVEQAANASLLRVQYIKGIESADFAVLPEPVYVRGFFKTYGDILDLDGAVLASQFSEAIASVEAEKAAVATQPIGEPSKETAWVLRPEHLLLAFIPFAIVVVSLANFAGDRDNTVLPSQGDINAEVTEADASDPSSEATVATTAPTPTPAPAIPQATDDRPIQVGVRLIEQESWVSVTADGFIIYEGTLQPGTLQNWSADAALSILAGNAGAVELFVNGETTGKMGAFGEVRQRLVQ